MESYLVRFSHQIGVGMDPDIKIRKTREKVTRYLKGLYFQGGPKTANRYRSMKEAQEAIDRHGNRGEHGSLWLGHCWPCEAVPLQQAYEEEGISYNE